MESTPQGRDCSAAGEQRARKMRTRAMTRKFEAEEKERDIQKGGLSQNEYWAKHVRSKEDIVRFYALYFPDYPECLAKSIAERVGSIVEKSQQGKPLTEDELGYYKRSVMPSPVWDPLEELKEHKLQAHVNLTTKRLDELLK